MRSLWGELSGGSKWAIAAGGIAAAVTVATKLYESYEKSIQVAQENAKAYRESADSVSNYKNEVYTLITSIDSGTLSSEELYNAKSRLLEIEDGLVAAFGSEAAGLDLLSASADNAKASIEGLAVAQAGKFLDENYSKIKSAKKQMDLVREFNLPNIPWDDLIESERKALLDVVSEHSDSMSLDEWSGQKNGLLSIYADAREMEEILAKLGPLFRGVDSRMRAEGDELGNTSIGKSFAKAIEEGLSDSSAVIDRWGDVYDTAIDAAIMDDKELRGLDNSIDKINKAYEELPSINGDSLEDRISAIKELSGGIDTLTESYDNQRESISDESVSGYFDDVFSNLSDVRKQLQLELDIGSWMDDSDTPDMFDDALIALRSFVDESGRLNAFDIQAAGVGFGTTWDETTANLEAGQVMYAMLANSLEQYNLTVDEAIPILKQYGIVSKSTADLLGDARTAYTSAMSEHEAVNTALSEQSAYGSTSLETYESLIAISSKYADCLSYQNGVLRINSEELQKYSEERANEKKRTIESSKALAELEYDEKTRELQNIRDGLVDYGDETENTIESLEREISELGIDINKYKLMAAAIEEATSARQKWLQAQSAPREDEAFTDAASALNHIDQVLNQRSSEIYGDVGTEAYKAALEFVVPQEVLDKGKKAIQDYVKDIKKYMQTSSGSITDINVNKIWKDIQHLFEEPDADGFRKVIEGTTLQDFADALGVTKDMAEALLGALNVKGFNLDWGKEAGDTFSDLATSAKESKSALDGLADLSGYDIVIDVTGIEDATKKVERLDETIRQAENIRAEFGVNSKEAEYAASIIAYCVQQKKYLEYETILSVDSEQVDGKLGNLISLLQQYVDLKAKAETETRIGGEVSAETAAELANIIESIKAIDAITLKNFGIDPANFSEEKIEEALKGITPDLLVEIGVDPEAIANFKAENEGSIVSSTFVYNLDRTQVDSFKAEDHNISATITYTPVLSGSIDTGTTSADTDQIGNADGTAHAYGTARARGDWGTAPGGRTLTGELGEELVVDPRSGRWYTVGSHGAEFVNLPKDAIVFNHLQTQALFNNGHIYDRGKAMANGNAAAIGLNNFDPASKSKNKSSALVVENAEISNLDVKAMQTGKQNNSNRPDFGKGNIDLNNRPIVENPNGGYSTVASMSIGVDGKEVLIPTVIGDKVVSADEAIKHYFETGEHLGVFDTIEEADEYAKQLHRDQERLYASEIEALESEAYKNYQDTLDNLYDVYVSGGVPEPPGGSAGPGSSKKQESDWYYAEPSIPMDGEVGVDYFEYDEQFNDIYKGHKHLIEMEQEDVGVFLDWLESSYMNAYNQGILNLEDKYKY